MKLSEIADCLKKELTDVVRDKRSLLLMLILPVLACPVFALMPMLTAQSVSHNLENKNTTVLLQPDNATLRACLQEARHVTLIAPISGRTPADMLLSGRCDVVLTPDEQFDEDVAKHQPGKIQLMDSAFSPYSIDENNVIAALDLFAQKQQSLRLAPFGIPVEVVKGVEFQIKTVESDKQRSAYWTGLVCTMMLMLTMTLCSMYPALDIITGERERGTLVLLLMAPVQRRNVVMAKLLTVSVTTYIASLLSLVSICIGLMLFVPSSHDLSGTFSLKLPVVNLIFSSVFLVPLSIVVSGCAILISSYARTFQQGQSYFAPLMIVAMALGGLVVAFDESAPFFVNLVPVANLLLCMHRAIEGQWNMAGIAATICSSVVFIALLLRVSVSILDREESLFGIKQPPSHRTAYTKDAFVLYGICLAAFFYVSGGLQLMMPLWGVFVSQLLTIALPALAAPIFLRMKLTEVLSLRKPKLLYLLGAALLAPGMALLSSLIVQMQNGLMPDSDAYLKALQDYIMPKGDNAWLAYITIAAGPAVCEELLFRGAIQGMLRKTLSKPLLSLVVAVLFGILHGSSFRFLPTTFMGFLLAVLTEYTGSIFPSMVAHCCNNALAVFEQSHSNIAELSPGMVAGAVACSVVGAALIVMAQRASLRQSTDQD